MERPRDIWTPDRMTSIMNSGSEGGDDLSGIFINYRVGQTGAVAHLLFERLVNRFGPDAVYLPEAAIAPGRDFRATIFAKLMGSDVVIAVIGADWTTAAGPDGHPRLSDPDDAVRVELATALAHGILVIPLLVEHTPMPAASELPEDLRSLTHRQYVRLEVRRGNEAVDELAEAIQRQIPNLRDKPNAGRITAIGGSVTGNVISNIGIGSSNNIVIGRGDIVGGRDTGAS